MHRKQQIMTWAGTFTALYGACLCFSFPRYLIGNYPETLALQLEPRQAAITSFCLTLNDAKVTSPSYITSTVRDTSYVQFALFLIGSASSLVLAGHRKLIGLVLSATGIAVLGFSAIGVSLKTEVLSVSAENNFAVPTLYLASAVATLLVFLGIRLVCPFRFKHELGRFN